MRLLRRRSQLDRWLHLLRRRWRAIGRPPGPIAAELERFARARSDVVFVQIGSNDGRSGDPLYRLAIRHRWTGLLVEPVPYLAERLQLNYKRHPQVRIERAAIADVPGTRDFWYLNPEHPLHRWYDQVGSFDREHVLRHVSASDADLERLVVRRPVQCLTLGGLLSKHAVDRVDLLHIDAEGYDGVILRSIDFDRLRPDLILFEHAHMRDAERGACARLLEEHGYTLIAQDLDTLALSTARAGGQTRDPSGASPTSRSPDPISGIGSSR
jgi:FkbM family methyltransferase